ncbi:heme-binding protein [Patescibacteria group bacterium]|nr:heme-binding protein [Patescibacteria group bacterium]
MNNLLIVTVLAVMFVLWTLWGYLSSRVEQMSYVVEKKADGYEIRNYPAHIVAQTTVQGPYDEALSEGFRIVAGYIFGGNAKKERVAMTAPVTERSTSSQKIAMTAPVLATTKGESHVISFGMPRSYTLDTLPVPTDSRVQIVEVPAQKMAALRFSWFRSDTRIQQMQKNLLSSLSRDGVEVVGAPQYAGYNAPWTPPWMSRNEVMVEIK